MSKRSTYLVAILALLTSTLHICPAFTLSAAETIGQIAVHNRILGKVNGKAITVVDVMKKLDMIFYKQFPEYTTVAAARFQFYQANWQNILQELLDKELILADAEENKFPVSNGDVRQEMESLFGPNIIDNLDKIGLSFDEAWKIVQGDILIRRMLHFRVNSKALRQVTPQDVRHAYEEFSAQNLRPDLWTYQVLSVRAKDPKTAKKAADQLHELLVTEKVPLDKVQERFQEMQPKGSGITLNISKEYQHQDKEISKNYKEILEKLQPATFSEPVSQKSRSDRAPVVRIFSLTTFKPGGPVPFQEVENRIRDALVEQMIAKETKTYLERLRKHFDVQEKVTEGDEFQPFTLYGH